MNRAHPSPELLHRYCDGDADPSEVGALREHVAACADCQAEQARLTRLRSLVNMAVEDSTQCVDFANMFANIERGIAGNPSASIPTPKQLPRRRSQRFASAVPALGAVALAAAVMLMLSRKDPTSDSATDGYETAEPPSHSEIVEVDFGRNAGTVFEIALADGSSNPVVWIDDDDDDDDDGE